MKVSVSILKEKENYLDVIEKLNNSKADYIHIDVQIILLLKLHLLI